jgi:hypothetical protein
MRRVGDYVIVKKGMLYQLKRKTIVMYVAENFVAINKMFDKLIEGVANES